MEVVDILIFSKSIWGDMKFDASVSEQPTWQIVPNSPPPTFILWKPLLYYLSPLFHLPPLTLVSKSALFNIKTLCLYTMGFFWMSFLSMLYKILGSCMFSVIFFSVILGYDLQMKTDVWFCEGYTAGFCRFQNISNKMYEVMFFDI